MSKRKTSGDPLRDMVDVLCAACASQDAAAIERAVEGCVDIRQSEWGSENVQPISDRALAVYRLVQTARRAGWKTTRKPDGTDLWDQVAIAIKKRAKLKRYGKEMAIKDYTRARKLFGRG